MKLYSGNSVKRIFSLGVFLFIIRWVIIIGLVISVSTCILNAHKKEMAYLKENNTTYTKEFGKFVGGVVNEFKEGMEQSND